MSASPFDRDVEPSHRARVARHMQPIGFIAGRPIFPMMGGAPDDGGDGGVGGGNGGEGGTPQLNEHGFPDNTPWTDMQPDQQLKYWQHQSRKHEGRATARGDYDQIKAERDTLKAASQTPDQKAIDDARNEAKAEARRESGMQAVEIHVKALASVGRMTDEKAEIILEGMDKAKYVTPDGSLDSDKLSKFLDEVAPKKETEGGGGTGRRRDTHQGGRNGSSGGSSSGGNRPGSVKQVMEERRAARAAAKQ